MRRWVALLGLAGGLAALQGAAHAQTAASHPAPTPARTTPASPQPQVDLSNPVLAFYPAAARAAHVEGQAVIRCRRDEHLALTGCTLVSETPAGQGFGAAALAMAARSPPNPKLELKEAPSLPTEDDTIRFQLAPPYVSPDLTRMAHVMAKPEILAKPTQAQVQAAYPPRALDDQIQGGAILACVATTGGKLVECRVDREAPTGYGFGQAALDLAADFTLKPQLIDGDPVDGPVLVRVPFTPGDPSAPLTLGNAPAPDAVDAPPPPTRPDRGWGGPDGTGGFGGPRP